MRTKLNTYVICFIAAGIAGVLSQLLYLFYSQFTSGWAVECALLTMGLIGGLLYISGLFQKLEVKADLGAVLPLSGYTAGISGFCEAALNKTGSVPKGVWGGCMLTISVIGGGAVFTFIYGLICGGAGLMAPKPVFTIDPPLQFLLAFLLTGALCTIAQVFLDVTKMDKIQYLVLWGIFGGLFSASGFMPLMGALGGTCGPSVLAFNAGDSFYRAAVSLIGGNVMQLITVIGIFVVFTFIGVVCGLVHHAISNSDVTTQPVDPQE
jgi:hypothetical protein